MNQRTQRTPDLLCERDRRLRRNSVPLAGARRGRSTGSGCSRSRRRSSSTSTPTSPRALDPARRRHPRAGCRDRSPTGIARNLPIASHVVLDYVLSLFLIVAPFIFSFTDDSAATAYFIVLGCST